MAKLKFNDAGLRQAGILNLHETAVVLESIKRGWSMEWWIEAGTFLGMVRDNDLIAHDSDIDFGIIGDEHLDKIKRGMDLLGFEIAHEFGTPGRGMEISFKRDGVKVDVFCFYEEGSKLWMGCWRDGRMIRLEFERSAILPTSKGMMFGTPFRSPGSAKEYLTARYGEGWKEPDPSWRWDRSPKCINWEKSDWSLKELEEKYP